MLGMDTDAMQNAATAKERERKMRAWAEKSVLDFPAETAAGTDAAERWAVVDRRSGMFGESVRVHAIVDTEAQARSVAASLAEAQRAIAERLGGRAVGGGDGGGDTLSVYFPRSRSVVRFQARVTPVRAQ